MSAALVLSYAIAPVTAAGLRRMVELGQPSDARQAAIELLMAEHMGGPRR